jgi:integrase
MAFTLRLKRPTEKESALYLEFKLNNQRFKFYPGKTIQTKNWSSKKQEVLSGEENYKLINEYLENWKGEVKRILAYLETKQEAPTKEKVQEWLDKNFNPVVPDDKTVSDFITFIDAYILPRKNRKREVQKLQQTKKLLLIGFDLISRKRLDKWEALSIKEKSGTILKADKKLAFSDVNLKFLEKFRDFLFTYPFVTRTGDGKDIVRHYKINYIDKLVKGLKQIINAAIEEGLVLPFRWTSIKAEDRQVDSVYTNFEEIQHLNDVHLPNKTDALVRDKYVLNCFLGLRYSDLNKLEPHLFKLQNIAGKEYVIYSGRAQKTDQKVEFALHPSAITILEKYKYNMPKLAATEFNLRIKKVARKAGLTELERIREIRGAETIIKDLPKCNLLSSHAGRRSFCTNFYNEGISISAIMSISGHSTEKEFRKYIKKASIRIEVVAQQVLSIQGLSSKLRIA